MKLFGLFKVIAGLFLIYWICISVLVLLAHIGVSKGQHPLYAGWVALNPILAYCYLAALIGLFGFVYRHFAKCSVNAKDSGSGLRG
jgi:hypothetical protein